LIYAQSFRNATKA